MKKLPSSLLLLLSITAFAGQAAPTTYFEPTQVTSEIKDKLSLVSSKRLLAQDLSLQYGQISDVLRNEITAYNLKVNVDQLQNSSVMNSTQLEKSDSAIKSAKGLDSVSESLVELRLADASMLTAWQEGQSPLFAFAPEGNDSQWDYIEAFDVDGNLVQLDVYTMPERPVFVVDVNGQRALTEGIKIMRSMFAAQHVDAVDAEATLFKSLVDAKSTITAAADDGSISTTVIKTIRLDDDEEPWISGSAEVYAIVNGVDPSRDEPVLDIVDMPYLDHDGTTYSPNQVVIHWERYRWAAADMILMEHDDGTNYKDLATALLNAASAIMRLIPDPAVQGYAVIPEITNGIISAMPDKWFTNDDDFVDVYYTILEGNTYNGLRGASGNATITLAPLTIAPR